MSERAGAPDDARDHPVGSTPRAAQVGADPTEIKDWLRLCHTPGVPPAAVRRLLAGFGLPDAIFAASRAQLAEIVPQEIVSRLLAPVPRELATQIDATLAWADRPGCTVITLSEPAYPRALLTLGDAPPVLYCRGDAGLPNRAADMGDMAAALVGSRRATPQGRDDARHFAQTLGDAGITIVSGLAAGIDAAAHEGALQTAGSTVAIVGTGADIVYPARHRALAERIAAHGLLLSAFPVGTPPRPEHFPRRNRLIAALARCTVVIEATTQSGSLITARLAGELGRDVLAVPGSIHAPQSRGCHTLIREGATLASSPEDVLEALGITRIVNVTTNTANKASTTRDVHRRTSRGGPIVDGTPNPQGHQAARDTLVVQGAQDVQGHGDGNAASRPPVHASLAALGEPTPGSAAILRAVGYDPVSADTLCGRTGMAIPEVLAQLGALELDGRIARLPGGRFVQLTPSHERR